MGRQLPGFQGLRDRSCRLLRPRSGGMGALRQWGGSPSFGPEWRWNCDSTGNGVPNDLNGDGSFLDEVKGLNDSTRYVPGATFWRTSVTHFTPWDCNWHYGPPPDAMPPNPEGGRRLISSLMMKNLTALRKRTPISKTAAVFTMRISRSPALG